jgi:hypothetical protein
MDLNADLTIHARRASVDVEDGVRHVGLAEGDEDEPYALFSQALAGGPVRLELNDPLFAAEGAIAGLLCLPDRLEIRIAPGRTGELGFARHVVIRPAAGVAGWDRAVQALAAMLPGTLTGATPPPPAAG